MRQHPALAAWLPTARHVQIEELLTVTKPSGSTWRFATGADGVTDGAAHYLGSAAPGGLLWQRSSLTFKAGIEMSECKLTISARAADVLGSLPVAAAIRAGLWSDATFLLARAYFDGTGALRGVLPRYQGSLATVRMVGGDIDITLKPPTQTLNRAVPPVYQASCINTLFDAACGVSRTAYTHTASAASGSTATVVYTGRTEPAGYYNAGVLTFTSGAMVGLARTVRQHAAGGAVTFFDPLPQAPAVGDAISLTPGCDRSLGDGGCAKFANRLRYRGTPYIPKPETAL